MAQEKKVPLGGGGHTLYSDEVWHLAIGARGVALEASFQSDAPERTGYPAWAGTEFCVSRGEGEAACQVPYHDAAHLLAAPRPSFVPEAVWAQAVAECRKVVPGRGG